MIIKTKNVLAKIIFFEGGQNPQPLVGFLKYAVIYPLLALAPWKGNKKYFSLEKTKPEF